MRWIIDPITKEPSVALTLLVVSSLLMIVGIGLEMFTLIHTTHLLDEMFGATMALYGGHIVVNRPSANVPPTSNKPD